MPSEMRRLARLRKEVKLGEDEDDDELDLVLDDIVVELLAYNYVTQGSGPHYDKPAMPVTDLRIPPGSLVCFPDATQEKTRLGVNTLFKLLAGDLLPTSGRVTDPERWRTLLIPLVPVLFEGTLMYNLHFSLPSQCLA